MLGEILCIVEDQEMARTVQAFRDPLDVMGATQLFVTGGGEGPVLEDGGLVSLVVAGRIAEAVQKVARAAGCQGDAPGGITCNECVAMVNDVELTLY